MVWWELKWGQLFVLPILSFKPFCPSVNYKVIEAICNLSQLLYFPFLTLQQIDGEAFLLLNQSDIVKILSIKLGPALKIYNAILMFKTAEEA